jgi:hypothetical protein
VKKLYTMNTVMNDFIGMEKLFQNGAGKFAKYVRISFVTVHQVFILAKMDYGGIVKTLKYAKALTVFI